MMMSGPAPEFEVTAVCWLMSSQPTKSTLTSTPVSLVNLAQLARNTSSSACTKRTGRSMRKDAPFSIANLGAGTSAALMADWLAPKRRWPPARQRKRPEPAHRDG